MASGNQDYKLTLLPLGQFSSHRVSFQSTKGAPASRALILRQPQDGQLPRLWYVRDGVHVRCLPLEEPYKECFWKMGNSFVASQAVPILTNFCLTSDVALFG